MNSAQIYIFSMAVNTLVNSMSMQAANQEKQINNEKPLYSERDFLQLLIDNRIYESALIEDLTGEDAKNSQKKKDDSLFSD